jgi:predicted flap endonuclease-1-like 5' DNA nuclease
VSKKLEPSDNLPNIGAPARRALANAGFARLEDLTRISEADLSKLHGMGPKAIRMLRETLEANGFSFAQT